MYHTFFGLAERPFDLTPDPRYLVLTEPHREALGNLGYAIATRTGITLLVGDAGTGKTTIIRTAIARQPAPVHTVHITNPALTRPEFVEALAKRFGLSERAGASKAILLLELEELLRSRRDAGERTVLIIDEAQSLPLEILEEIRLLANIETERDKLLSVIIAGQPEIAERLNDTVLRQLKQRIALRCHLRALTLPESTAYVAGRVRVAGGTAAQLFTRDAVVLMHQCARGIPRTLSVLAGNALLTAFAGGQRPVTRQIVLDVCRDFDLTPSQDGTAADPPLPPSAEPCAMPPARVLALDAPAPSDTRAAVNESGPVSHGSMFSAFYEKRRRFSFF